MIQRNALIPWGIMAIAGQVARLNERINEFNETQALQEIAGLFVLDMLDLFLKETNLYANVNTPESKQMMIQLIKKLEMRTWNKMSLLPEQKFIALPYQFAAILFHTVNKHKKRSGFV